MKKLICLVVVLFSLTVCVTADEKDIIVILNGEAVEFSGTLPIIVEGRVMVPMRAIFEALGAEVTWNQQEQTAYAKKKRTEIEIQIGNQFMRKNWSTITLDVAFVLENGRTLVPVRAIAESFGVTVEWDSDNRVVRLLNDKVVFNNMYLDLIGLTKDEIDNKLGDFTIEWLNGPVWVYGNESVMVGFTELTNNYDISENSEAFVLYTSIDDILYNIPDNLTIQDLSEIFGDGVSGYASELDLDIVEYKYKNVKIYFYCDQNGNILKELAAEIVEINRGWYM